MSSYEQISVLPYQRELVWHALTRPELLAKWLPAKAPKIAPDAVFRIGGIGGGSAKVTQLRAPREFQIRMTWGAIETYLNLRLSEIVRGTRVTIEHVGFDGPRAWMIKTRLDARAKRLIERDLPTAVERMLRDPQLQRELAERGEARTARAQERQSRAAAERVEVERAQAQVAKEEREAESVDAEREQLEQTQPLQNEVEQRELEGRRMEEAAERARVEQRRITQEAEELQRTADEQAERELLERKAAEAEAKRRAELERERKRKKQTEARRAAREERARERKLNQAQSTEATGASSPPDESAEDGHAPDDLHVDEQVGESARSTELPLEANIVPQKDSAETDMGSSKTDDNVSPQPRQDETPERVEAGSPVDPSVVWDEDFNTGDLAELSVEEIATSADSAREPERALTPQAPPERAPQAPAQPVETRAERLARESTNREAQRETEEAMRKRLFGELTSLLESARGEALNAFRDRFNEAGIEFDSLRAAPGGGGRALEDLDDTEVPVKLERGEAVAQLERRQEHERIELRRLHDELDAKRRSGLREDRGTDPLVNDHLESRLQQERRMLEQLLRDRQVDERQRFEGALDSRLVALREAQEEAHRSAEADRRLLEEERQRVESERRQVEDERRRLAEDEARRRAEEIARESVRLELERSRFIERQSPRDTAPRTPAPRTPAPERDLADLSPREVAAEQRMRTIRAQRAEARRRREEEDRRSELKPEQLAREARLRAAIEKADRASTKADAAESTELRAEDARHRESTRAKSTKPIEADGELTPQLPNKTLKPQARESSSGLSQKLSGLFGRKRNTGGAPASDQPRPDRDGRVLTLHPNDEHGSTIDIDKYLAMRAAILAALPYDERGIELKDLPDLVRPRLAEEAFPRHVSITWYCVRVKWDLEARGLLEVVPKSIPERVRRTSTGDVRKEA